MIKNRLSLAILAATLSLAGCIGDDEEQKVVTESYVGFDPVVAAADGSGRTPVIPFPFDALFAGAKTPTLNIPNSRNLPFVANANLQDGFSTTASWFIDIFGFVDMATVASNMTNPLANNLIILNRSTGLPLVYGTDFTIETSTVKDGSGVPINAQRTRLLIEPLKPLAPNTTYVVLLKKGVKTLNGGMVQPSYMFGFLNSDTPIANVTDSYFARFSATEKANLEALRNFVRPIVKALAPVGATDNNVLLAYSVTTQSTTKTMDEMAKMIKSNDAGSIAAAPIGQTVKQVLITAGRATEQTAPPNSDQTDVYVGTVTVPYYGDVPTADKPTAIASSYWKADATKPDAEAGFLGKPNACGAYAAGLTVNGIKLEPSKSTTTCFPMPIKQSEQTIPMIVTVPKGAKPEGGWPVVIFQHGITRNRTDIFAVASTYAKAGFVTVAIDLPLHGLPAKVTVKEDDKDVEKDNPFYKNSLLAPFVAVKPELAGLITANERTFDVDIHPVGIGTDGKLVPTVDGKVDGSGTHFINLINPISSRDNLRQGASDILVLAKNLANLNLDTTLGGDVNTNRVYLSSISLGTIVGTVALGADKDASLIKAASVSVGGGAIVKLLDASRGYGPEIANGLAKINVLENTDDYETFMRFAQTLTDSGDPINFAMNAKMNRPIHFTQVLNDLVVPNAAVKGAASATQDYVGATGFLSGNTALAKTMSFSTKNEIDITSFNSQNLTGSNTWVQFNQGGHGSLLDPTSNAAVTTEMQCQSASFFATAGAVVQVGCSKP
ncbi:MAG: hypothetical protein H6996_10950 [Moraxellaceae bacterium]|nr:hypothetical protein [Moraxellaceae bacterium]MCP5178008.1 hypothetical protein [Moraxellaceae bacterium]